MQHNVQLVYAPCADDLLSSTPSSEIDDLLAVLSASSVTAGIFQAIFFTAGVFIMISSRPFRRDESSNVQSTGDEGPGIGGPDGNPCADSKSDVRSMYSMMSGCFQALSI